MCSILDSDLDTEVGYLPRRNRFTEVNMDMGGFAQGKYHSYTFSATWAFNESLPRRFAPDIRLSNLE